MNNDYITKEYIANTDLSGRKICSYDFEKSENLTAEQNATIATCDAAQDFYSMQYSLIINIIMVFLGGICFFLSAIYIVKDKEKVERFVAGNCFEITFQIPDIFLNRKYI